MDRVIILQVAAVTKELLQAQRVAMKKTQMPLQPTNIKEALCGETVQIFPRNAPNARHGRRSIAEW